MPIPEEAGEIWPTVCEKAFAKLVTEDNSDKPDILKTVYCYPVGTLALLTGLTRTIFPTRD